MVAWREESCDSENGNKHWSLVTVQGINKFVVKVEDGKKSLSRFWVPAQKQLVLKFLWSFFRVLGVYWHVLFEADLLRWSFPQSATIHGCVYSMKSLLSRNLCDQVSSCNVYHVRIDESLHRTESLHCRLSWTLRHLWMCPASSSRSPDAFWYIDHQNPFTASKVMIFGTFKGSTCCDEKFVLKLKLKDIMLGLMPASMQLISQSGRVLQWQRMMRNAKSM